MKTLILLVTLLMSFSTFSTIYANKERTCFKYKCDSGPKAGYESPIFCETTAGEVYNMAQNVCGTGNARLNPIQSKIGPSQQSTPSMKNSVLSR